MQPNSLGAVGISLGSLSEAAEKLATVSNFAIRNLRPDAYYLLFIGQGALRQGIPTPKRADDLLIFE